MLNRFVAFFLFVTTCFPLIGKAQLYDSLRANLKMKPTLHFKLDSRNSFISNYKEPVFGVKIGADFGKKLRLGFGYNFLKTSFITDLRFDAPRGVDVIHRNLRVQYFCSYIEYVFYTTKKWEFSVPVQFGIGAIWYKYSFKDIENLRSRKYLLLLYEPTLSGQYKVFDWLGGGLDVGFRFALHKNKNIEERLTFPTYSLKLLIYWGVLYNKVFPKYPLSDVKKKFLRKSSE